MKAQDWGAERLNKKENQSENSDENALMQEEISFGNEIFKEWTKIVTTQRITAACAHCTKRWMLQEYDPT